MQSSVAEQEIPVRWIAFVGGLCVVHVDPVSEVPTTYGVELKLVPTATQVVSIGHATDWSSVPNGIARICQVEKFVVVTEVAPPPMAIPTATQVVEVEHDRESSETTVGLASCAQVLPLTLPIAAQVVAFEHDTVDSESVEGGGV